MNSKDGDTSAYENFEVRLIFNDRLPDDQAIGPARSAKIEGRCTKCWGSVAEFQSETQHFRKFRRGLLT